MTSPSHIVAVAETWHDFTAAMVVYQTTVTPETLRALIDTRNAHVAAVEAALLGLMKSGHGPVLERSMARAAKGRT